ncbi:hypothetical protein EI94DRAFT_1720742 [Lactarius quietus]|nr:hypothetical protein EI94DRAFT_1720742 [Lactarius quietus]
MGLARPPSYRTAQESYLSKEMTTGAREIEINPAETTLPRSPTRAPRGLAWPNRPNRTTAPAPSHAASNLGQSSLGSATTEAESPRPGITRCTRPPESTHPPQYRSRELSFTPTLPPYSATGGSFSPSREPQPQDRSPGNHVLRCPTAMMPESAVSRIQAAFKVSNELGNAVMLQEVRVATPIVLNPRATRRFVSVTEMEDLRKVNARLDRHSGEREARQRALSKPSDCGRRNRDGKIHRTASERVNPMKMRDVSRR